MKLLAGSLNVEVDQFLHAGYISAYPRSFDEMGGFILADAKTNVLEVGKALELKQGELWAGQLGQSAETDVAARPAALPPASMASDAFTAAVLFFFFAFLISVYYRRIRKVERPGWRPWLLAAGPLLLFLVIAYSAYPKYQEHALNSLPPPWRGVPVQEYKSPEAATHAIVQSLIVPALAGCPIKAKNLSALQREVAFPVPSEDRSPGMAYALKAYGRDGWGREFLFELLPEGRHLIRSAGADGSHGTADDIVVTTTKERDGWEDLVNGVYVRRIQGDAAFFVHRVEHHHFRWLNMDKARRATGTDVFDVFSYDELLGWVRSPEEGPHPIMAGLEQRREASRAARGGEPLFFIQMISEDNG